MIKLRFLLLIAIIFQLPFYSIGQFSRDKAKALVLNQILVADTGHISVYSSYDSISDTTGIILLTGKKISLPYNSSWVFLSDDDPFADWNHPCRYIIVNSENGDYTIDSADIYPVGFQNAYGLILAPAILPPYVPPVPPCPDIAPTYASPNPHLHAVLICGIENSRWDGNLAVMYNTLKEAGYPTKNIDVLYCSGKTDSTKWGSDFDHNGTCDINHTAYRDTINFVFNQFATGQGRLGKEDQLLVYVTASGGYNNDTTPPMSYMAVPDPNSQYYSSELVNAVRNIPCAQMIFIMNPCYSGGFVHPLIGDSTAACRNRIVQTAADTAQVAHPEFWISGESYDEFTFYYSAALRGHYPGSVPWEWGCKVGDFPFTTWYPVRWGAKPHPSDYNPDNGDPSAYDDSSFVSPGNSDRYTQFVEAFNYANCMDTWSENGYYNRYPQLWTGIPDESPQFGINNGFSVDDLFCVNGIAGNTSTGLSSPQTVAGRSYLLGGNLNILSDINISQSAEFTMGVDNAIIDAKPNVNFHITGQQVKFTGMTTSNIELLIENTNNQLDLEKATFKNMSLQTFGSNLIIENHSTFTSCPFIISNRGSVNIQYSSFTDSPLTLYNHDMDTASVSLTICNFTAHTPIDQILIEDYNNYTITNDTINGGHSGLNLYYSGNGTNSNLIQNNYIGNCIKAGINVFSSHATVKMNQTYNNYFGIEMVNNTSQTTLTGNQNAQNYTQTQYIHDCSGIEVYATDNCFPSMTYNAVINPNASVPNYPLVYYDDSYQKNPPTLNIQSNCWGSNFTPGNDFHANYGTFTYIPVWCPSGGGGQQTTPDEALYDTAMNDVQNGDYTDAETRFQSLVLTYPKSAYSKEAMKEMFSIEPYTENDFNGLSIYYLTNDSIMADTALSMLGDYLANNCKVKLQDWPDAISWYEDKIQNPINAPDSIFAIIDLGHLYLIMDTTGQKSTYIGSLPQYKPKSKAKYVTYRDSLIDLLPFPKEPLRKSITRIQSGQLLQNVPNPSRSSTNFYFKLFGASNADIKIYDSWGQLKQVIPITDLKDGTQKITFDTSTLPAGVYEYSLSINERKTDTKKMVVIK